jgi:methyltransferase (TIGR00027 family)
VVLLAAGLDARAFRLDWPAGTRLFELDLPDLLDVKKRVLTDAGAVATCERVVVPADLTGDWLPTLEQRGFEPSVPTAWLVEGLLVYLAPAEAERLLATVTSASAAGSRLALERGSGARTIAAEEPSGVAGLFQGGVADPIGWLTAHGWDATVDDLGAVAAAYGRPPSRPAESGFVRAVRC